jgi:hypothetical protein
MYQLGGQTVVSDQLGFRRFSTSRAASSAYFLEAAYHITGAVGLDEEPQSQRIVPQANDTSCHSPLVPLSLIAIFLGHRVPISFRIDLARLLRSRNSEVADGGK